MKKITFLLIVLSLFSCAHAQKKQDAVDTTTLAYGNYLLKLPTEMLPNAVLLGGSSSDSNYIEGVAVKFNDKQSLWGGVFTEELSNDELDKCSDNRVSSDLKEPLNKVKEQLTGHKAKQQYIAIIAQSGCRFDEKVTQTNTDISSQFVILSRCQELQCDTYVVNKQNTESQQILTLFSKGFEWNFIKQIIKGA